MNDLEYMRTLENGNKILYFPHDGHIFHFEVIDHSTIRIHDVDVLSDVQRVYDQWADFENLPAPVRAAISRSHYRMRSTKATLEGAMSHGD